jgi:hypothetical protein
MLKRKTMKTALAEVGSAGKASATVAKPGVNCWQRCRAERAAFLVDAADYYRALRSSIIKAERSVIIWAGTYIRRRHCYPAILPDPPPTVGPSDWAIFCWKQSGANGACVSAS